jgi:hypothetical protein
MTTQNPMSMGLDYARNLANVGTQVTQRQGMQQQQGIADQTQQRQGVLQGQQDEDRALLQAQNQASGLVQLSQGLMQLPMEQRMQAIQAQAPMLQSLDIDISDLTPEAITDEGLTRIISTLGGAPEEEKTGTYNPRDYTTESWATFLQTKDPSVLKRYAPTKDVDIGGVPHTFDPATGGYMPSRITTAPVETAEEGVTIVTPESVAESKALIESEVTGAKEESKRKAAADAEIISEGRSIARNIPVLKQSISLLEAVTTGGWTNSLRNIAKQKFGVESAEEGVLTANLGKAVLSQLRQTFGAAFTAQEGESLKAIEAGFGKSPETNRVLLGQLLQMSERQVRSAIDRAKELNDTTTVRELEDMLTFEFDLGASAPEQDQAVAGPTVAYQEGQTATGPNGAKMIFQSGGWVAQ